MQNIVLIRRKHDFGRKGKKFDWKSFISFGLLFSFIIILGIFHTFFINWKAMISYFKKKKQRGLNRKKELIASSAIILISFFGTISKTPPFQSVMDIGEYFTESWESKDQEAPMAHTEAIDREIIIDNLKLFRSQKHLFLSPVY